MLQDSQNITWFVDQDLCLVLHGLYYTVCITWFVYMVCIQFYTYALMYHESCTVYFASKTQP